MEHWIMNKIMNLIVNHSNHVLGFAFTLAALVCLYMGFRMMKKRR